MLLCTQTVVVDHEVIITRRADNHHPNVWGDHFLAYVDLPGANEEEKKHEVLKEEVRKMLVMTPSNSLEKLELINTIQCLGLAYHFESEIDESLNYMHNCYDEYWIGDLHAIALCFRLLRQQGYYVSCDAFKKFTNDQGKFKEELVQDVQGMLSLYEAAQFRVHGEQILDEALNFTITQLKLSLPKLSNSQLAQQITNALKFPSKDGITSTSCKHCIKRSYLISQGRDELTLFTRAVERWNIDASEQLPSYMKILYRDLLDTYDEIEKELANENKSFLVNYSIIEMKKVLRDYFQEAKWYHEKKIPKMEQYMKNGIPSSSYLLLATTSWLAMGKVATKDAFDWIATQPSILVASSLIMRLLNDLSSHEEEQKRGDAASSIECYMKEYGVMKEEAHTKIRNIIQNYWKDLNEEYFKVDVAIVPRVLLMPIINLTRVAEFMYKDEDAYTFSKNNLKDVISPMVIDHIISTDDNKKKKNRLFGAGVFVQ
ncbi:hypothetical protein KY284_011414 [Solanum tuberosum]|nr:hypothetical protein KY284_011414 [Solanum tuberosum]